MLYYSNGSFTWSELYNMPTKFRKFYLRCLLEIKRTENEAIKTPKNTSKSNTSKRR